MVNSYTCCFTGHRQVFDYKILEKAEATISALVKNGVTTFYTGGMGDFDDSCSSIVRSLKRKNENVKLYLIIPYMKQEINKHKNYYEEYYDDIVYPFNLIGVHYKSAIKKGTNG